MRYLGEEWKANPRTCQGGSSRGDRGQAAWFELDSCGESEPQAGGIPQVIISQH